MSAAAFAGRTARIAGVVTLELVREFIDDLFAAVRAALSELCEFLAELEQRISGPDNRDLEIDHE
jgi:hypothetical protein